MLFGKKVPMRETDDGYELEPSDKREKILDIYSDIESLQAEERQRINHLASVIQSYVTQAAVAAVEADKKQDEMQDCLEDVLEKADNLSGHSDDWVMDIDTEAGQVKLERKEEYKND